MHVSNAEIKIESSSLENVLFEFKSCKYSIAAPTGKNLYLLCNYNKHSLGCNHYSLN